MKGLMPPSMKGKHSDVWDIASVILIVFIVIFSAARFKYLPQYIDGYYHLSCANAFEKSAGWIGIDWWNFAPVGRPHLYPPFYHLLLLFLKRCGMGGLGALKLTEAAMAPVFFIVLWAVSRREISRCFSFFFVLIASSFFSFYSSISANVPASFAIIFGVLSWFFLKNRRYLSAILFFSLCFYTHSGIPWIFFVSFIVLACGSRRMRMKSLLVCLGALILAAPILAHQLRFSGFITLVILHETQFSHFSIIVTVMGVLYLFFCHRRKDVFVLLFFGYLIGSMLVFFKYPYRFFSAQGALGFIWCASGLCEEYITRNGLGSIKGKTALAAFFMLFFIFHPTLDLNEGKMRLSPFNATYYNIASGRFDDMLEFSSLYYPRHYDPLVAAIQSNSSKNDIISSNVKIAGQIFSALSNRPTAVSILGEVLPFASPPSFESARLLLWLKPPDAQLDGVIKRLSLKLVYENDIAYLYRNPSYRIEYTPIKASVGYRFLIIIALLFLFIFVCENVTIFLRSKRNATRNHHE